MHYKQNNYDVILNYTNNEFEYSIESLCGERTLLNNKNNRISTYNHEFNKDQLLIRWDNCDFLRLELFLRNIFEDLKAINIELSAHLKLHNELISIDDKEDQRAYGFIKIILLKNEMDFNHEFPITDNFSDFLKNQILNYIDYIKKIVCLSHQPSKYMIKDKYPVIFSPQAAGCFIHEIIGHLLEEDFFDFYNSLFNEFKVSDKLVIYDDIKGFENFIGLNKIDDEGTEIKPLKIVSGGKINNIMAVNINKSFDKKLYGFSRRENFKSCSFPRMRCTAVKTGNDGDLNSIILKSDDAIFMSRVSAAYMTPGLGSYTLIGEGFEIKKGAIVNFISKLTVKGNILDDLKHIEYIGNDSEIFVSYCNKLSQLSRVGVYTPTISLSRISFIEGFLHEKN